MEFNLEISDREWQNAIDKLGTKVMPKVAAISLSETAKDAVEAARDQAHRDLDNPTRFTATKGRPKKANFKTPDAFGIIAADKKDEVPTAIVGIKDRQADYLKFQIDGGVRRPGDAATVGQAGSPIPVRQRTNKAGNMPRGKIGQLLQQAQADSQRGTDTAIRARNKGTLFVGTPKGWGDAPFGIWQRPRRGQRRNGRSGTLGSRKGLRLLVSFERSTEYRPRYQFSESVKRAAIEHLPERYREVFESQVRKQVERDRSRG